MVDVVTPNFHRLVAEGRIINNPMAKQTITMTSTPARLHREGIQKSSGLPTVQEHGFVGNGLGGSATPLLNVNMIALNSALLPYEDEASVAVSSAWANVDESEIMALASLGEMPETVRWIASILRRAIRILSAFKAKNLTRQTLKALGKPCDTFSDLWLECRYAIRPLVFEMHQAVSALQSQIANGSRNTARGFHRVEDVSSSSAISGSCSDICWTEIDTVSRHSNYRAGVLYTIDSDVNGIMSVWGLDKPLETIWELTPFSFIIDWFFNIGDIIASWSYNPSLHARASWITEEHKFTYKRELVDGVSSSSGANLWSVDEWEPGVYHLEHILKRRLPSPRRSIMPQLRINLDVSKISDIAAIGRGILYSILGRRV
jgi:hypothetical protein